MTSDDTERERRILIESVGSAVYVAISLLAVLMFFDDADSGFANAWTLGATALALTFGHLVATRIGVRLASGGVIGPLERSALAGQVAAGAATGVIAVVPVLVNGGGGGVLVSELLLLAIVAVFAYASVRVGGTGRLRAAGHAMSCIGLVGVVLVAKRLAGH